MGRAKNADKQKCIVEISIGRCVTKWRRNIKLRICDFHFSAMERNFYEVEKINDN